MADGPNLDDASHTADSQSCVNCAKPHDHQDIAAADGPPQENTFHITIKLPHEPYTTQTIVSTQDQAQDIRQSIIDLPHTYQYSCFHLERNGERIPDFTDLAEIPGIAPNTELSLVEDPYTEKDSRIHFLRIRDLLGAAGDKTSLVHGIQAGTSLHDGIAASGTGAATAVNNKAEGSTGEAHALSDYDINAAGTFDTLLPPQAEAPPKTVKSITLSPWNPPPYHLRIKGHLLYLQITTNEGEQYQLTSHVSGFFVNKSSSNKFDPMPKQTPKTIIAHSLLTLISKLSPSFDASFRALQEHNARKDPLSTFIPSNAIPASPWLVPQATSNLSSHQADSTRSQENYLIGGIDNSETLRDWNEEFQTTRELPRETVQDRVFRERVTSKLYADYNDAAVQGAVLIARGEVPPLNPTENHDAQIFVYNNVFYSFGADGVGTFANEGGDEAARVATGKDVIGVKSVNQLDIPGLAAPGTVVIDYLGKRLVGQSIVPGIFKQREPGEQQIDYGGVEGKDVVAENEQFVPLFSKLSAALHVKAHSVWDKEKKRHDLEASVETKGLLGTDGRKYVLDLYRITPLDVSWIEQHWVEPKTPGERPKDTNSYPHRMTVLRPELVDGFWRLKLREYARLEIGNETTSDDNANSEITPKTDGETESSEGKPKTNEQSSKGGDDTVAEEAEKSRELVDLSKFKYALNPDVFSGQEPQSDEEKETWSKDEAEVREACDYLHKEVIPRIITDLQDGEVGFPMDGQSLTTLLHRRGINIRYLGKLAELSDKPSSPRLQALKALTRQEMIARAFKHIASQHLRTLPSVFAPYCLSHLLNCLLGVDYNAKPQPAADEDLKSIYPEASFDYEKATPETLRGDVSDQVSLRYRYDLGEGWISELKHVQTLREISLKLGLQLVAREYAFAKVREPAVNGTNGTNGSHELKVPEVNGHGPNMNGGAKKKKRVADRSPNRAASPAPPVPQQTFQPDDIQNVVPIVKDAAPKSVLAEEALEAGRLSIVQNQKELGQELLLESLSLHEQIYGILHAEVARVYYQLSTLFYGLDDKAIAVELARKAVIVSERVLGVDSNETVLSYLNLGLFEHAAGNSRLALTYVRHALNLWKIVYGVKHPDSITTLNNAAVMLQHLKLYHDSRLWFEASLEVCQEVSGQTSVNTATLLFQLAQALALDQDSKGAVNRMREAYNIFNNELGANDRNTKEAESWLEQLTQNAVSIAKHAKDIQTRRLRQARMIPGAALGTRLQPRVGQTQKEADTATVSDVTGGGAVSYGEKSIEEIMSYIQGGETSKPSSSKKKPTNPKRRQQKVVE